MLQYVWDKEKGRYYNPSTGRPVKWERVRKALDQVIDVSRSRVEQLAKQLNQGSITVDTWREAMRVEIKQMHVASMMIARGGQGRMTNIEYGRLGGRLRGQYAYLDRFAEQIKEGVQPLGQQLINRALQYSNATRGTYEGQRRHNASEEGYHYERRRLHALESCDSCKALSKMGWQPLNTLPGIGDADCRANCRCTFEFR